MLDFLLKWVTGRNIAALGALAALAFVAERYQEVPRAAYERWRYPPQAGPGPRAAAIEQELERKERLRLRALHRDVSAEIARARRRGLRVDGLQRLADAALALDMPGYRLEAMRRLNDVRLRVPAGDVVRAAGPSDDERFDVPPDVRGRARRRR